MKKLQNCELYQQFFKKDSELKVAIKQQLSIQGAGIIAPEHIETQLVELRQISKNAYFPFLSDALALYEQRGLIRLFNLANVNAGKSKIPTILPFFPAQARARHKEGDGYATNGAGNDLVVFLNMYRIGGWNADDTTYRSLSARTDLYSCLETGVINYKMLIGGMAEKVFSDKNVIEYLTKIYVYLVSKAIIKTKTTFGGNEFNDDAASFLIARFFLLNILEKADSEIVDDYAKLAIKNNTSLQALKNFEEISMIDYTSLSSFLKTFGAAFFNGEEISLINFESKWVSMYGDATGLAIEYVPFLLHFLFAAYHGANLGGASKLFNERQKSGGLDKIGLPRLYLAVVNILK